MEPRYIWKGSFEARTKWQEGACMKLNPHGTVSNPALPQKTLLLDRCFYVKLWPRVMTSTISRPWILFQNWTKTEIQLSFQEGSVPLRPSIPLVPRKFSGWHGLLVDAHLQHRVHCDGWYESLAQGSAEGDAQKEKEAMRLANEPFVSWSQGLTSSLKPYCLSNIHIPP